MKILFVTSEVPYPPDNGVRIVSYNAMRLMSRAGHEVSLAVLTDEFEGLEGRAREVAKLCGGGHVHYRRLKPRPRIHVQVRALVNGIPYFAERYRSEEFADDLRTICESFSPDVIHYDTILMTQYRSVVPRGIGAVASINDSYSLFVENMIRNGYYRGLQYLYRVAQLIQVRRYEAMTYREFDAVHVVSEIDARYLQKLHSQIPVVVISNGVDAEVTAMTNSGCDGQARDVVYVATLRGENLDALRRFLRAGWPIVRDRYPGIRLRVVGRVGHEAQQLVSDVSSDPSVVFMGYVPKLPDAYQKCGIAIAPIDKDCGILNKVIEAMGAGLAVVGFRAAFSGVSGAQEARHFVAVTGYEEMGAAVADLIEDSGRCRRIQEEAKALVIARYSWEGRGQDYQALYQGASAHAASRARDKD